MAFHTGEMTQISFAAEHDERSPSASIIEVGPRDGFQAIKSWIPTDQKKAIIQQIYDAGIRRVEATSFVSEAALPQMADAAEVMQFAQSLIGLECQVLVPTMRHAQRAWEAGANRLSFVVSASAAHNQANVRRTPADSVRDYAQIIAMRPQHVGMRINIATSFDCPFTGTVPTKDVIAILDAVVAIMPTAEFALCDTTGKATPRQVSDLFHTVQRHYGTDIAWTFHAHDTYGMGAANIWAAWTAGISSFDAAIAGVGGCPYAPGAKGNVATEDVAWLFEKCGIDTGIDITKLLTAAHMMESLPDADLGGRVRDAMRHPCAPVTSASDA